MNERRVWKRAVGMVLLGGVLLGASTDSPTCDASCIVTEKGPTSEWRCSCRWAAPFGLACAQRAFTVPAGARLVSPATTRGPGGGTTDVIETDVIELTGGQFTVQPDGQLVFTASHPYEIGEQLTRRPYAIPYRFEDSSGRVLQTGTLAVTQINVRGK